VNIAAAECECEGCAAPAVVRVEAQWTIADWDWVDVCEPHVDRAIRHFEARTIDGKPPLEFHVGPLESRAS
jgi:hypothetical protein